MSTATVRNWDPLNDRQIAVLKRVARGDTLGSADNACRRSASALCDRGLVTIGKRDGWRVTLTDAGAFYIRHGCHPRHPGAPTASTTAGRTSKRSSASSTSRDPLPNVGGITTRRSPSHATARISRARRVAAEQLMAALLVSSPITIAYQNEGEVAERRRVVDFAKRHGLVPVGTCLQMTRKGFKRLEISLRDGQHPNVKHTADETPIVPMPTDLRSLHPVVARLQQDSGRLTMPANVRRRSLLFLHGLTREAVRRGYDVREEPVPERYRYQYLDRDRPGHRTYFRRDGELNIVIEGFAYTLTITQESPNSDVDGRWERLVVSLTAYRCQGRQYSWHDRKRVSIDDRIAAVLRELETRAAEDKQRQLEAERQKAERRRQWEAAMERARRLAVQAHYARSLNAQVDAWQRKHDIEAYCDALERTICEAGEGNQLWEATQWLDWAREYADAINPLRTLPTMPEAPELHHQDLEPYLDGWSPYGPEEPTTRQKR